MSQREELIHRLTVDAFLIGIVLGSIITGSIVHLVHKHQDRIELKSINSQTAWYGYYKATMNVKYYLLLEQNPSITKEDKELYEKLGNQWLKAKIEYYNLWTSETEPSNEKLQELLNYVYSLEQQEPPPNLVLLNKAQDLTDQEIQTFYK